MGCFLKIFKRKKHNSYLKGITTSVWSHLKIIADEERPSDEDVINSITNCSVESDKELDGTDIVNKSISGSGCIIPKYSFVELKVISQDCSPGTVYIEYSPAERILFPNFKSDRVLIIVCRLAPVLQYLLNGTKADSDSGPNINLSFLNGAL